MAPLGAPPRALVWSIVLAVALAALYLLWQLLNDPELLIRRRGGTELVYTADLSRIAAGRDAVLEETRRLIRGRLLAYGLRRVIVAAEPPDRLVLRIPRVDPDTIAELRRQVESMGSLTLRLVPAEDGAGSLEWWENEGKAYLAQDAEWVRKKMADPAFSDRRPEPPKRLVRSEAGSKLLLENGHDYDAKLEAWVPSRFVGGQFLSYAAPTLDDQTLKPAVAFQLQGEGATILLDDKVVQSATIQERISSSGILRGNFTDDDVRGIVTVLRSGSLPARLTLVSERTLGSGEK